MSRHLARLLPLLAIALLGAPSPAPAQSSGATTATLALGGPAASALRDAGARVTADGPGAASRPRLALLAGPLVRDGDAFVGLTGELRVTVGRRTARLEGLEAQLTGFPSVSARTGGRRIAVLTIDRRSGSWSLTDDGAEVRGAAVRLTSAGARALRRRLRAPEIAAGRLGRLTLRATAAPAPTPVPALPTDAPAGARPIVGGTVRWAPRASWVGYLRQGEGAGAESGASFDGTAFALPVSGGWYDAASGTAAVRTAGTARFRYSARGIDIALGSWSYEISGGRGVASAIVERAQHIAESPDPSLLGARAVVQDLDATRLVPALDGARARWDGVPLTLAESGAPLFNAYPPGSEQGSATIDVELAPPAP
jgi:hypothetical protein